MENFDIIIVGGGPAGLACGIEARRSRLSHLILEKGALANTLVRWPANLVFFSTAELIEIGGLPFPVAGLKPTRREALVYYRKAALHETLNLHLYEKVSRIETTQEGFTVTSEKSEYGARSVVLATGFFDLPNLIGVPGEDLAKVTHYYTEPYGYSGTETLVVGGKNSAVEAALELYRNGARVTVAVRERDFGASVKYWLKPDIENRVKEGAIRVHFETVVSRIGEKSVWLSRHGRDFEIPNDFVLALTGYHPDFDFLKASGAGVTAGGEIVYNGETMETETPGLYVAGVVAGGADIGRFFIENGRFHARQIVAHILKHRGREAGLAPAPPAVGLFQEGD